MQPDDRRLAKYRFSPFVRNTTDVAALLESRGIAATIVVGTATNVGVESTVRDAMMLGFDTYMPHDAVVAPYYDGHLAAMRSVVQIFADVRPVDALIDAIAEAGPTSPTSPTSAAGEATSSPTPSPPSPRPSPQPSSIPPSR